jgi:hypothetical protein
MRKFLICFAFMLGFLGTTSIAGAGTPPVWTDNGLRGVYFSTETFDATPIGPTWPGLMSLQGGDATHSGSWIVQEPGNTIAYHSWDVWLRAPASPTPYITGRFCGPQNVTEGAQWAFYVRFAQFNNWNVVGIGSDLTGTYQPAVDIWVDAAGRVSVPQGPPWTSANLHQIGTLITNQWYFVMMRVNPAANTGRVGIYYPGSFFPVAEFSAPLANTWGGNNTGVFNARCLYAVPQPGTNQDIYFDYVQPGHLVP